MGVTWCGEQPCARERGWHADDIFLPCGLKSMRCCVTREGRACKSAAGCARAGGIGAAQGEACAGVLKDTRKEKKCNENQGRGRGGKKKG